jgi:eukaryotic-like serine/threonine-protein kinase
VRTWPALRRTYLLRIEFLRLLTGYLRARCAVARCAVAPQAEVLATAERFVVECARMRSMLAQGWGLLIDAALTASRGQREPAIAKLQLAEERLRDVGAAQHVAASRRRRGQLMNDANGTALIRLADSELAELGATNPERMVERLIPGTFFTSRAAPMQAAEKRRL